MAAWRVLDFLSVTGVVDARHGHVLIEHDDGRESDVALVDVHTVLVGENVTVTSTAMQTLADFRVSALFCDWRGVPVSGATGWTTHTFAGQRQRGQLVMGMPARKQAWKTLMVAKILGQAQVLLWWGDEVGRTHLVELSRQVRSGDPDNIEAQAARFYWSRIAVICGDVGFRRLSGQGGGGINGYLDYGYTVLRGAVIEAVLSAGLWPAAGVHHSSVRNQWCLVDDLIEPFRASVDHAAVSLWQDGLSMDNVDTRHRLVGVLSEQYCDDGSSVQTWVRQVATRYSLYVCGQRAFEVPVWTGASEDKDG